MNLTDIQPENQQLKKRLILVVSKGTIDMLYPALVLATTAPAMGMKVDMYFTFWGLKALTKDGVNSVKIAPVGNPCMPIPNIVGLIPGMTKMASTMMFQLKHQYLLKIYLE